MASKIDELKEMAEGISLNSKEKNQSDILIKNDNGEDAITKTDLTNVQVKAVTQIRTLADVTGNEMYDSLVNTFINAQVSLHRKSRSEFIANNQSILTNEQMREKKERGINGWIGEKV